MFRSAALVSAHRAYFLVPGAYACLSHAIPGIPSLSFSSGVILRLGGLIFPSRCLRPGWLRPQKSAGAPQPNRDQFIDAEFVAQALSLEHGWRQPNTLVQQRDFPRKETFRGLATCAIGQVAQNVFSGLKSILRKK